MWLVVAVTTAHPIAMEKRNSGTLLESLEQRELGAAQGSSEFSAFYSFMSDDNLTVEDVTRLMGGRKSRSSVASAVSSEDIAGFMNTEAPDATESDPSAVQQGWLKEAEGQAVGADAAPPGVESDAAAKALQALQRMKKPAGGLGGFGGLAGLAAAAQGAVVPQAEGAAATPVAGGFAGVASAATGLKPKPPALNAWQGKLGGSVGNLNNTAGLAGSPGLGKIGFTTVVRQAQETERPGPVSMTKGRRGKKG